MGLLLYSRNPTAITSLHFTEIYFMHTFFQCVIQRLFACIHWQYNVCQCKLVYYTDIYTQISILIRVLKSIYACDNYLWLLFTHKYCYWLLLCMCLVVLKGDICFCILLIYIDILQFDHYLLNKTIPGLVITGVLKLVIAVVLISIDKHSLLCCSVLLLFY